jgi:hypothetical protein
MITNRTKTVTVVPAEPGYRIATLVGSSTPGEPPYFSFYPVVAWRICIDTFDRDGEEIIESKAHPVTLMATCFQSNPLLLACPDGEF